MVLPPPGGGNAGSRDREGEDIGPQEKEYGRAIRCDATDSGPMRGFEAAEGDKGPPTLVGTEGPRVERGKREGKRSGGGDGGDGNRRQGSGNSSAGGGGNSNDDGSRPGSGDVVGVGGAAGSERIQWGGVERGGVGIKSRNSLRRDRFWPYARVRSGGGGQGSPNVGGNRRA